MSKVISTFFENWLIKGNRKELLNSFDKNIVFNDKFDNMKYFGGESIVDMLIEFHDVFVAKKGYVIDRKIEESEMTIKIHWECQQVDILKLTFKIVGEKITDITIQPSDSFLMEKID